MDFNLTDEQRMLWDTLCRMVDNEYDINARHAHAESKCGFSRDMWSRLADMGVLAIPFAEENGGFGGGGVERMLVMEAFGRGLLLEPYLASIILGGGLVERAGDQAQRRRYLKPLLEGELLLAVAHQEPQSRYSATDVVTSAERCTDGFRLRGHKAVVFNGESAGRIIVSARIDGADGGGEGISLFIVDACSPGVHVRGYRSIDGGRTAEIELDNVAVDSSALLGEPGTGLVHLQAVHAHGASALCGEAVGIMEYMIDATLTYLKQRKQFGTPLASFQVLQHRVVDMRIQLEQARSMAILAATVDQAPEGERQVRVAAAKAFIGQAGRFVAEQAIQLHGGVGMTWEYALSHYAKRLVMIDHQLGDAEHHLEAVASP
ncbi:MAG: acyl-CoA dehydrogenase [Aquisalimonadaceae bacterium]